MESLSQKNSLNEINFIEESDKSISQPDNKHIQETIQIGDYKFDLPLSDENFKEIAKVFGHKSNIQSLYEDLQKAVSIEPNKNFINYFQNYNGLDAPKIFNPFYQNKKERLTVEDCKNILKSVIGALETNYQIFDTATYTKVLLNNINQINTDKISPDKLEELVSVSCKDLINNSKNHPISYQYYIGGINAQIAIYEGEVYVLDNNSKELFEDSIDIKKLQNSLNNSKNFIARSTNSIPIPKNQNWETKFKELLSEEKEIFVDYAGSVLFPDINNIKRRRLVLESFQEDKQGKVPASLVRHLVSDDKNIEEYFEDYIITSKPNKLGLNTLTICGYKSDYKPMIINTNDDHPYANSDQQSLANNLLQKGHFVPFKITSNDSYSFGMAIKKEDNYFLIFVGDNASDNKEKIYGKAANNILNCLGISKEKVIIKKEFSFRESLNAIKNGN